jgi:glycerol-1-phosphate dehydrogenase [NAD(P)+]
LNVAIKSERLRRALEAARETKELQISHDALNMLPVVFREQFPGKSALVIADDNTFKAAGSRVCELLNSANLSAGPAFIFHDPELYAEFQFVTQLQQALSKTDAIPIAVGSGTINDLTKLASFRTGREYLCVATAASMDGYTAYGASITFHGSKQTFECPAPKAVIADLQVISAAPRKMNASGYADLMAKITAGADWIVADALGVEKIDSRAWEMVQQPLREWLANPDRIANGDSDTIEGLVEGLMMGGFAMQWCKSSRPASGADHQFSHLWDMQHHLHNGTVPSHGFKVGIGTLASARLYEFLFGLPFASLDIEKCVEKWPATRDEVEQQTRSLFDPGELCEKAIEESIAKWIDGAALRAELELLKRQWPELSARLKAHLPSSQELRSNLAAVGSPFESDQIGVSPAKMRKSYLQAYHIRRRYTVLDVAMRTDTLKSYLNHYYAGVDSLEH